MQTPSNMAPIRTTMRSMWLLLLVAAGMSGCATLRPLPGAHQPVVQAAIAGLGSAGCRCHDQWGITWCQLRGSGFRVPGWCGGYYVPRNYNYSYDRWHHWPRGPLFWGLLFWTAWHGSPWFWPWFYDGPRYYAWSRSDAQRFALPEGTLPVGGRTGGGGKKNTNLNPGNPRPPDGATWPSRTAAVSAWSVPPASLGWQ